jgi:hypothetical protein
VAGDGKIIVDLVNTYNAKVKILNCKIKLLNYIYIYRNEKSRNQLRAMV